MTKQQIDWIIRDLRRMVNDRQVPGRHREAARKAIHALEKYQETLESRQTP